MVYHEGYRIDELRIFGVDISEYVIEYSADANENMKFAVSELQRLIKKGCGAELDAFEGTTDAEHKIIFRHTSDETLRDDGYRYFEEDGALVIEGAVARGCMYGVYRFLEVECNWRHLIFGTSVLEDSSLIDIPVGINKTETPAFDFVDDSANGQKYQYVNDRTPIGVTSAQNSYGAIENACHGIYQWVNDPSAYCYSYSGNLDFVYEKVTDWLDGQIKSGKKVGQEIKSVDIAMADSHVFCLCSECSEIYAYDKSYVGPIVQFANSLSEMLEPDYSGLKVLIFGYFQTIKPPEVSKPSDSVYITYAPNGNCCRHALEDGHLCTNKMYQNWNNVEYGGFLKEWCEMSDNVYVWYYSWGLYPKSYAMLEVFYRDLKWFYELGVKGIYINRMDQLLDTTFLTDYMLRELSWTPDLTEEEFEEYLAVLMKDIYGDGWAQVREVSKIQYESQLRADRCLDIWQYDSIVPRAGTNDPFYYDEAFETIVELMDDAISKACTKEEQFYCYMYASSLIYMGTTGGYFAAYDAGDTERLQWLSDQYARIAEFNEITGHNPLGGSFFSLPPLPETLEELMWTYFYDSRNYYTRPYIPHREEPDWVTEMRAETEAEQA